MRSRLRLAYIDETVDWDSSITAVTGRIATLYLYDAHQQTFCCEMTPSYACYLVGYLTERSIDDTLQMALQETTDVGQVSYIHCRQVDRLPRRRRRANLTFEPFVAGCMPCTLAWPHPYPHDHETAIAAVLEVLTSNGYTTT